MKTSTLLILAGTLVLHSSVLFAKTETGLTPSSTIGDGAISLEKVLQLRDPFRRPSIKLAQDGDSSRSDLEKFAVEQLKLVGIIAGAKKNKALITTPEGRMHIVTENTRLGVRKGLVKRISPDLVQVEERITNILGREEKIHTVLEFKKENVRAQSTTTTTTDARPQKGHL